MTIASSVQQVSVVIVGAGFGGLGMAIRLKQRGIHDFLVLERAGDVGGTWRDNSYPGCACDVESHLYSFSFAPNPGWSHTYSPQPEIQAYLRQCAERFGLLAHLRFGHEVKAAAWDESACRWLVETDRGTVSAGALILAMGPLSEPLVPELPGLGSFQGNVFHSANWDHSYAMAGRRIAVVGTGASAIQFVPQIQPLVAHLTLFQRTAPWVVPRVNQPLGTRTRWLYRRFPAAQKLQRLRIYLVREAYGLGFKLPKLLRLYQKFAIRHLTAVVKDPALRAKLTPHYTLGCKRVLLSNDYYPALTRDNVAVVTAKIREVRPHAVCTDDGAEHAVDAIIFGTGFHVTDIPHASRLRGRDGRTLADVWQGSPRGFLGTTVVGFPNLFLLAGPNTGLGHSSIVLMLEAQIGHVLGALAYLATSGVAAVEPTPAAQRAFNEAVARNARGTVWNTGGCASWYIDRTGYNSVIWPSSVTAFKLRVRRFRPADYATLPTP